MNNKEILNKVDEIINNIESSNDYRDYLKLKEIINNDSEITALINNVRVKQKDFVHHLISEDELNKAYDKLNNHPVYREYLNKVDLINNQYAIIESNINKFIDDNINN